MSIRHNNPIQGHTHAVFGLNLNHKSYKKFHTKTMFTPNKSHIMLFILIKSMATAKNKPDYWLFPRYLLKKRGTKPRGLSPLWGRLLIKDNYRCKNR